MDAKNYSSPAMLLRHRPARRRGDHVDLGQLVMACRRQRSVVLAGVLLGGAVAAAAVLMVEPKYTAVETVLIGQPSPDPLGEISPMPEVQRNDATIQSEIEIVKSRIVAERVASSLGLAEDPAFMNPPSPLAERIIGGIRGAVRDAIEMVTPAGESEAAAPEEPARTPLDIAAGRLGSDLEVSRVGQSFVIQVSYTGTDPVRTARIASAIVDEYKQFRQFESVSGAENAGEWLRGRLEHLKIRSEEAAQELRQFRMDNNLVAVKGELLSDQRFSELTTRLIAAQGEVARTGARLEELEALLDLGSTRTIVSALLMGDTGNDQLLEELRRAHQTAHARREAIVARWGESHPEAVRLAEQIAGIDAQITGLLQSAVQAVQAEHKIAREEAAALRTALDELRVDTGGEIGKLGELRRLEAAAETYNQLYSVFLRQLETVAQQPSYPMQSVSVLSRAEVPTAPSSPRKKLGLALGLVLGGLAGAGIGAWRELRAQRLRTPTQARTELGVSWAGLVPDDAAYPCDRTPKGADRVLLHCLNGALEAIDAAAAGQRGAIVSIAPVMPLGDTRFAGMLADFAAARGRSVLLIEVVTSRPADPGEIGTLAAPRRRYSGVDHVRLAAEGQAGAETASRSMSSQSAETGQPYDMVICDLPPLTRSLAAEIFGRKSDATLALAEWDRVAPAFVEGALAANPQFAARLAGIVLAGADLGKVGRYIEPWSFERAVAARG